MTARLPAGGPTTIQIAGVNGLPLVGSGVEAFALNFQALPGSGATGYLQAWSGWYVGGQAIANGRPARRARSPCIPRRPRPV